MKNQAYNHLPSPCWILEESKLLKNLKLMQTIQEKSGAKILLALKGYALWRSFPLMRPYLQGCCASGLHEAKLASEMFQKEVHTYSPAFKEEEIEEIASLSEHLLFNSPQQFWRFAQKAKAINPKLSLGLRINPEYSHAPTQMYNPCGTFSRLGTTLEQFDETLLPHLDGLHFHALCEESVDALIAVLEVFEAKFGKWLSGLKWVNFGGGHHITKEGYDVEKLIQTIQAFKKRYGVEVYLEPGEAMGWETGRLMCTVLDIVENGMPIAILDTSAEAHMPDTILMPYRAEVTNAYPAHTTPHTYRLGGNTCLAGDIMGDYAFNAPLKVGDRLFFEDQMHYTMVKATTFNGIALPSIAIERLDGNVEVVRQFGYESFKSRLG